MNVVKESSVFHHHFQSSSFLCDFLSLPGQNSSFPLVSPSVWKLWGAMLISKCRWGCRFCAELLRLSHLRLKVRHAAFSVCISFLWLRRNTHQSIGFYCTSREKIKERAQHHLLHSPFVKYLVSSPPFPWCKFLPSLQPPPSHSPTFIF